MHIPYNRYHNISWAQWITISIVPGVFHLLISQGVYSVIHWMGRRETLGTRLEN